PAYKQNALTIFLFDPTCDLIEVGGNLLSRQYCFTGKALKIMENIEAIRVVFFLRELLRDRHGEAAASSVPRSEENLAMLSCGRSTINVNPLFLSADRKSVSASMRDLSINTRAQRYYNDNAILHPDTRTHGLLIGSVSLFKQSSCCLLLISDKCT